MKTAFLLGSGVSLPARAPSVHDPHPAVLTKRYSRTTHERFVPPSSRYTDNLVEPPRGDDIRSFLGTVEAYVRELRDLVPGHHDDPGGELYVNYEDLHALVSSSRDCIIGEIDDTAHVPAAVELRERAKPVLADCAGVKFQELCGLTLRYIEDVVVHQLVGLEAPPNHLQAVIDACCDPEVEQVFIITTNHDVLIEQTLAASSIEFSDGFVTRDGCDWWAGDVGYQGRHRVILIKVHGSIDWYRLRQGTAAGEQDLICKTLSPSSSPGAIELGGPLFLAGRFNKELNYTREIFFDQLVRLRNHLAEASHLVTSGYGFADKGINSILLPWIRPGRRLLLAHENPETARQSGRFAIERAWDRWSDAGQAVALPQFLGALTWEEIKRALRS